MNYTPWSGVVEKSEETVSKPVSGCPSSEVHPPWAMAEPADSGGMRNFVVDKSYLEG